MTDFHYRVIGTIITPRLFTDEEIEQIKLAINTIIQDQVEFEIKSTVTIA